MNRQKWKYLMWFIYGMLADRLIYDATSAFSRPWTGEADQQGLIIFALLLLIFSVGAAIAWLRRTQRAN